ncbi:matrixin family metalloprotease [Limosilactobacillus sp.]|uniref:matrixin family metalloprotease n=1 Tax=Limosilactobacillus sp. TaxID=2773925 RepID=UPI00345E58FF
MRIQKAIWVSLAISCLLAITTIPAHADDLTSNSQPYFNSGSQTDQPVTGNEERNEPKKPLTIPTTSPVPLEGYRWKSRRIHIYMETDNPQIRAGFRDAVKKWNHPGIIHFVWTKHRSKAQVIASDGDLTDTANDQTVGYQTSQLGTTETSYDPQSHAMLRATSILDSGTLAGTSLHYRSEVAQHELGHALGLGHAQEYQHSVMVPRNVRTGITKQDIRSVRLLYGR